MPRVQFRCPSGTHYFVRQKTAEDAAQGTRQATKNVGTRASYEYLGKDDVSLGAHSTSYRVVADRVPRGIYEVVKPKTLPEAQRFAQQHGIAAAFTDSTKQLYFIRPTSLSSADQPALHKHSENADGSHGAGSSPYRLVIGEIPHGNHVVVNLKTQAELRQFAAEHHVKAPCLTTLYVAENREEIWSAIGSPEITPGLDLELKRRKELGQDITEFPLIPSASDKSAKASS